jgi:hypothetical protein
MATLKQAVTEVLQRSQQKKLIDYWTLRMSPTTDDNITDVSVAFKILLGGFPTDTVEICTHLDPTLDQQAWLAHFEVIVLPTLVRYQDCLQ